MNNFIGDYETRTDPKNRIGLPAAFRKELEGGADESRVVIKKDLYENCLGIYPRSVWDSMMDNLRSRMDPYKRSHAQFLREFQRNTLETGIDSNGRVLIPQRMLDLVAIEKDVVLLGVSDHIELWSKSAYEASSLSENDLGALGDEIFSR